MPITATELRRNVYRILDEAIASGVPVEVVRKGQVVRLVPKPVVSKLDRLKKRSVFVGDPDDILDINWLDEWSEMR
jgi:prevent-host-death family protein